MNLPKILKQEANYDIKVNILKSDNSGVLYVTIHQDNKTIFLEHSKIVEFLKTVNTLK